MMTDMQLQTILISVTTSALVTGFCFAIIYGLSENSITKGSQIPRMKTPPSSPKRKEPISFTPEQVNQMVKSRKKDKIKSLEEDVERWRNMFFNSEKIISEIKRERNKYLFNHPKSEIKVIDLYDYEKYQNEGWEIAGQANSVPNSGNDSLIWELPIKRNKTCKH